MSGQPASSTLVCEPFTESDICSTTPCNSSSAYGARATRFAKLPQGASFINVGRGPQLDQKALLDALDSGHLRDAILDVAHPELPPEHPFWTHPRVR